MRMIRRRKDTISYWMRPRRFAAWAFCAVLAAGNAYSAAGVVYASEDVSASSEAELTYYDDSGAVKEIVYTRQGADDNARRASQAAPGAQLPENGSAGGITGRTRNVSEEQAASDAADGESAAASRDGAPDEGEKETRGNTAQEDSAKADAADTPKRDDGEDRKTDGEGSMRTGSEEGAEADGEDEAKAPESEDADKEEPDSKEQTRPEAGDDYNIVEPITEYSEGDIVREAVSVALPTEFALPMFGFGDDYEIRGETIPIENTNDFDITVQIKKVYVRVERGESEELKAAAVPVDANETYGVLNEAKRCSLQLIVGDAGGAERAYDTPEGVTEDVDGFTVGVGQKALLRFEGKATDTLEDKWADGDLSVYVDFSFGRVGQQEPSAEEADDSGAAAADTGVVTEYEKDNDTIADSRAQDKEEDHGKTDVRTEYKEESDGQTDAQTVYRDDKAAQTEKMEDDKESAVLPDAGTDRPGVTTQYADSSTDAVTEYADGLPEEKEQEEKKKPKREVLEAAPSDGGEEADEPVH